MSTNTSVHKIIWPEWFDAQKEFEMTLRGYVSHIQVQLDDGRRYPVYFVDPTRLQQDLEQMARSGEPFFAEPGLIVLPEVTTKAIETAVRALAQQGYFQHFKPSEACLVE